MRGTNVGSWYAMPFRIVPDLGQRPENSVHSSSKQRCHVLQHNNSGLEFSNHANGLEEQSASLAIKSCPSSGVGNILTWETACNDIDPFKVVRSAFSDVFFAVDFRPVLCEDIAGVVVDFDLPLALHSCSFKSKIESSYSSKQTSKCYRVHP
jgi:hypothetical protein